MIYCNIIFIVLKSKIWGGQETSHELLKVQDIISFIGQYVQHELRYPEEKPLLSPGYLI